MGLIVPRLVWFRRPMVDRNGRNGWDIRHIRFKAFLLLTGRWGIALITHDKVCRYYRDEVHGGRDL